MSRGPGGSAKGRVIGHTSVRIRQSKGKLITFDADRPILGTCSWCAWECHSTGSLCPRCGGEVDPITHEPHQHVQNTHTPGSVAFGILGGFVYAKS